MMSCLPPCECVQVSVCFVCEMIKAVPSLSNIIVAHSSEGISFDVPMIIDLYYIS